MNLSRFFRNCTYRRVLFCMPYAMQTRSSHENSVRPSVCLSNAWFVTKWKKDRIFISYKRPFSLVFWEEDWLVGSDPFYLKFWVNWPRWSEIADFQPIFARSSSAVTLREKSSINTNRKSTMRFPVSLRWSSYVAPKPPKGVSKTQNSRFTSKIALRLKKVCYKVFFVWKLSAAKL